MRLWRCIGQFDQAAVWQRLDRYGTRERGGFGLDPHLGVLRLGSRRRLVGQIEVFDHPAGQVAAAQEAVLGLEKLIVGGGDGHVFAALAAASPQDRDHRGVQFQRCRRAIERGLEQRSGQ